jgi:hypothetical protein
MDVPHRRLEVVDVLERLGEDEAVEGVARNVVGRREIGDDRRRGIRGVDVQHVAALDADAEALGVPVVQHLEHPTADRTPLRGEKPVDVVAVDRSATIAAPVVAERRRSANRSEPGRAT